MQHFIRFQLERPRRAVPQRQLGFLFVMLHVVCITYIDSFYVLQLISKCVTVFVWRFERTDGKKTVGKIIVFLQINFTTVVN